MSFRIRPATTDYSGESSQSSSSQNNPPPAGTSRFSAPSGAGHAAREKPQVKSKSRWKHHWGFLFFCVCVSFNLTNHFFLFPLSPQKSPPWWPKLSKHSRTDSPAGSVKETECILCDFNYSVAELDWKPSNPARTLSAPQTHHMNFAVFVEKWLTSFFFLCFFFLWGWVDVFFFCGDVCFAGLKLSI